MKRISIERIVVRKREEERCRLSSASAHGIPDFAFSGTKKMAATLSGLTLLNNTLFFQ